MSNLRRSRSFEVTDVNTSRRPACDFLLVNNTNFLLKINEQPLDHAAEFCYALIHRSTLDDTEKLSAKRNELKHALVKQSFSQDWKSR